MSLPERIRVKLSSEAAEAISLTPVVVREIALRELIDHMLGVTGKDAPRIRELLRRGTLVSGASRFRWEGWEPDAMDLDTLLASFPDADPQRPFAAPRCVRAVLRGGRQPIDLPRQACERKPLFRRASFWDVLLEVAGAAGTRYTEYSYRDRADRYRADLAPAHAQRLRAAAGTLRYSTLREQLLHTAFLSADLYVERE